MTVAGRRQILPAAATRRLPLGCALLMLLTACQAPVVKESPASKAASGPQVAALWTMHRQQLGMLTHFSLSGRIASDGPNGGSGGMHWTQSGARLDVKFSGPLGVGAMEISGTVADAQNPEDDLVIQNRNGKFQVADAESQLRAELGWSVPLVALRDWIVGLPARATPPALDALADAASGSASAAVPVFDGAGRLLALDQFGWHLDYLEYRSALTAAGTPLDLPRRIALTDGQRHLRVVVDEWDLAVDPAP